MRLPSSHNMICSGIMKRSTNLNVASVAMCPLPLKIYRSRECTLPSTFEMCFLWTPSCKEVIPKCSCYTILLSKFKNRHKGKSVWWAYQCRKDCDKIFASDRDLQSHQIQFHAETIQKKDIYCQLCCYSANKTNFSIRHNKGVCRFKIIWCGFFSVTQNELKEHVNLNHCQQFKFSLCGNQTKTEAD